MTKRHDSGSASPVRDSAAEPNEQAYVGKHNLVDSISTSPVQAPTRSLPDSATVARVPHISRVGPGTTAAPLTGD